MKQITKQKEDIHEKKLTQLNANVLQMVHLLASF
jgi:hypothetical protein